MKISELKTVIKLVCRKEKLKPLFFYGTEAFNEINKVFFNAGQRSKVNKGKIVIYIYLNSLIIYYQDRIMVTDYHVKPLTELVFTRWINKDKPLQVDTEMKIEDVMIEVKE